MGKRRASDADAAPEVAAAKRRRGAAASASAASSASGAAQPAASNASGASQPAWIVRKLWRKLKCIANNRQRKNKLWLQNTEMMQHMRRQVCENKACEILSHNFVKTKS